MVLLRGLGLVEALTYSHCQSDPASRLSLVAYRGGGLDWDGVDGPLGELANEMASSIWALQVGVEKSFNAKTKLGDGRTGPVN